MLHYCMLHHCMLHHCPNIDLKKAFRRSREKVGDKYEIIYNKFLIKRAMNLLLVFSSPEVNNINTKFFLICNKWHLEMGDYIWKNFYYY
jgi:hypothetical protein